MKSFSSRRLFTRASPYTLMLHGLLWAATGGLTFSFIPAHAQTTSLPERLSFEQATVLFFRNNPDLAEARARSHRLAQEARVSALWPNPSLDLDQEGSGAIAQQFIVLDQPLRNPVEFRARREAAEARTRAAGATYRDEAGMLYLELARRYTGVAAAQARLALLRDVTGTVQRAVTIAETRFEEGDLGSYELARLRVALADYEDALAQAQTDDRIAHAELALLLLPDLGTSLIDTLLTRFIVTDTLAYRPFTIAYEPLRERAFAARGLLTSARADVDAEEATLRAERTARLPGVSLRGGLLREPGQQNGDISPVVSLGLELPLWNRGGVQVRAAEASLAEATTGLEAARRTVMLDLYAAYERLQSYDARIARIAGNLLQNLGRLLPDALYLYAEGDLSLVELLDAAAATRDARLLEIELLSGYTMSRYELERAAGILPQEIDALE